MRNGNYNSATHGPIPLSMEARKLMQTLREAIGTAIRKGGYDESVAHARGELAKYMSTLERVAEPWRAAHYKPEPFIEEKGGYDPSGNWNFSAGYDRLLRDLYKDAERSKPKYMITGTPFTPCPQLWMWPDRFGPKRMGPKDGKGLTGAELKTILVDDPQQEKIDMSKKAVATRKKAAAKLMTVGVRFLKGPNLDQIYTYRVKRTAKLHLGQEVVTRNAFHGTGIAVVVTLDHPMPPGYTMETLVELTQKVAAI